MLKLRIDITCAAAAVLLFAATATVAEAQGAASSTVGAPVQLVQPGKHTNKAAKPAKTAAKAPARLRHVIARKSPPTQPQPQMDTQVAQADDAWSAVPAAPFTSAPPVAAMPPLPVDPAAAGPSQIVIGGQPVQVASPNEINTLDLAAKDRARVADAATAPATDDTSEAAATKADSVFAAVTLASQVGSTSWILQVLAALGGALAAGSAAWFLIGSSPQRMYG